MHQYKVDLDKLSICSDSRGSSFNLNKEQLNGMHIVTMNPSAVRGNHIHEVKSEILCILGGENICQFEVETETGDTDRFIVDGDFQFFKIPPGRRHTVTNIGERVFYLAIYFDEGEGEKKMT